jgi:branched-chain amino acid transport system substrate-binding protein
MGQKEGGMDKLKGKKIGLLYHDSAYGKESHAIMDKLAAKHGFEVIKIAVAHPGNEQQSQWLQIRQAKPDYVVLWGWGVMNPTAIKAAAKTGFPREKLIGVWWSGAEEDTIPAGTAAKGFIAAGFNVAGANYLVGRHQEEGTARTRATWKTRPASARCITTAAWCTASSPSRRSARPRKSSARARP